MNALLVIALMFSITIVGAIWQIRTSNKAWSLLWVFASIAIASIGPMVVPLGCDKSRTLAEDPPKIIPYRSTVLVTSGFYKGQVCILENYTDNSFIGDRYMARIHAKFEISDEVDPKAVSTKVRDGKVINIYPRDEPSPGVIHFNVKDCEQL